MTEKYRRCVGMMIVNNKNKILVGKRLDHPSGHWQMPQGGIDENENPEEAVWREMQEEIGTNNAKMIKQSNQWINYKIPLETLKTLPWGQEYVGQTQKWFLAEILCEDSCINLNASSPIEFVDWTWSSYWHPVNGGVDFKKATYRKVLKSFLPDYNYFMKNQGTLY